MVVSHLSHYAEGDYQQFHIFTLGLTVNNSLQAMGSMIEHVMEANANIMIFQFAGTPSRLYPSNGNYFVELDSADRRTEAVKALEDIQTDAFTCIGKLKF